MNGERRTGKCGGAFAEFVRARAPAALAVLAACVAGLASPAPTQAQSMRERWNEPIEPFRIIDNIYYVGTKGLGVFLIVTAEGHFLLDGALPESAPLIERNIRTLGFELSDVKYLLNSHAHFDHSGGLAQLKRSTGAQLIASEGDRSALEGGFYLGSEHVEEYRAPPVDVDRVVADGDTVALGGVTLTANLTPGHTRGCTSWSTPVSEGGRTLQALFFCSSSVAANRLGQPPQYAGIVADYEKTFARARTLKVDVFLAGHTEFFDLQGKRERLGEKGANPFVDSSEFAAYIKRSEEAFRRELARQQALAQGE
jgi:metallo-beta-lactamase class B